MVVEWPSRGSLADPGISQLTLSREGGGFPWGLGVEGKYNGNSKVFQGPAPIPGTWRALNN